MDDIKRKKMAKAAANGEAQYPGGVPAITSSPLGVQFQLLTFVDGTMQNLLMELDWDQVVDLIRANGKPMTQAAMGHAQDAMAEIVFGEGDEAGGEEDPSA